MSDFWQAHYNALYASPDSVTATITPADTGVSKTVTAKEKTVGELIELGDNDLVLQGVKAAAVVRMSEITEKNLSRTGLRNGSIALNGKTWKIHSTRPAPGPLGESSGELYLYLLEVGP